MSASSPSGRSVVRCVGCNESVRNRLQPNMIIVLFHVLYLLGKYVYRSYRVSREEDEAEPAAEETAVSNAFYAMKDPNASHGCSEASIRFFPPAYVQRYVAVSNVLSSDKYSGKLRKIVDFGCSNLGFLVYLKNTKGVEEILCVDVDRRLLEACQEKAAPLVSEYIRWRSTPLKIEICEGSVTHNDKKLEKTDAVVCIELIEHLYPDVLTDLPFNIFGYVKPMVAIFTTPNADFNVLFTNFSGSRHPDHKFEWTREQFQDWAYSVVTTYPDYEVSFEGICSGPNGTEHLGGCTQMAIFHRLIEKESQRSGVEGLYKTVAVHDYPFSVDNRSDEQKILDEAAYHIRKLAFSDTDYQEEVALETLLQILDSFSVTMETLKAILEDAGWSIVDREIGPAVLVPPDSSSSDHSAMEDGLVDNGLIDNWDVEPGSMPEYTDQLLDDGPYEEWGNEVWEEEPCILIPQNNTDLKENTYLYDGENTFHGENQILQEGRLCTVADDQQSRTYNLVTSNSIVNTETYRSYPVNCLGDEASAAELSLGTNLDFSSNSKISQSGMQQAPSPGTTRKLYQSLEYGPCMSTSRTSTSPDPFLLEMVKMDQLFKENSISNYSTSDYWMMNSTRQDLDVSKDTSVNTDGDTNVVTDERSENNDSLHSIYKNLSYKESNSDNENSASCYKISSSRCSSINDMHSVQYNSSVQKESNAQSDELTVKSNTPLRNSNSGTSDSSPQFTSTPKVTVKSNTSGKKRKSLVYDTERSEQDVQDSSGMMEAKGVESIDSLESTSQSSNSNSCVNRSALFLSKTTAHTTSGSSTSSTNCSATNISSRSNCENATADYCGSSIMDTQKSSELTVCTTTSGSTERTETLRSSGTDAANLNDSFSTCQATNGNTTLSSDSYELKTTDNSCDSKKHAKDSDDAASVLKAAEQCECLVENRAVSHPVEIAESTEMKLPLRESLETPPNSWSPEVIDSGYPNSGSAQDMSPEYDLSSIIQDHLSDSESASVAEAPRAGLLEPVEVENGDLANNNRDGEGNNMVARAINEFDNLQPFMDVLENDRENDNDIYGVENGFPVWLLRILEMNPIEMDANIPRNRVPDDPEAGENARYDNADNDEGFDNSSSEDESDLGNNEMGNDDNDVNENVILDNIENDNENALNSDGSD